MLITDYNTESQQYIIQLIKKYLILFLSFFSFIFLVVSFTFLSLNFSARTQKSNNLLNIISQQKTISQKISKNILIVQQNWRENQKINSDAFNSLIYDTISFEKNLDLLNEGGKWQFNDKSYSIVPIKSREYTEYLKEIESIWAPLRKQIYFLKRSYDDGIEISKKNNLDELFVQRKIKIFSLNDENENFAFPNDLIGNPENIGKKLIIPITNSHLNDIKKEINNNIYQTTTVLKSNNNDLLENIEKINFLINEQNEQKDLHISFINIGMIIFCFFYLFLVSFFLFRRLIVIDMQSNKEGREKTAILDNVQEGLFLMNKDWIIEGKGSLSLNKIFNKKIETPTSFHSILKELVEKDLILKAEKFIDILFNTEIEDSAIPVLNPLKTVSINYKIGDKAYKKYLSINFNKINHTKNSKILVTILDSTDHYHLEETLAQERSKHKKQLGLLANIAKNRNKEKIKNYLISLKQMLIRNREIIKQEAYNTTNTADVLAEMKNDILTFQNEAKMLELSVLYDSFKDIYYSMHMLEMEPIKTFEEIISISELFQEFLETTDIIEQIIGN